MKFGKQIQFQQITEWQNHYMSYKGLKKIINSLIQEKSQTSVTIAASPPPGSERLPPPVPEDEYSKFLQEQKAAFFFKLERELEKVNTFYLQKEAELKVRLRSLIDKEKVILSRQGRPGSGSSINSLKEAFRQFEQDLNKLQKFVETNGTGFRKILKKWDKRSKSSTKELYLSRQVELQPCFNQDAMVELADSAALHLLGLENIQQGNSRPSSSPSSPIVAKPVPSTFPANSLSSPAQQQMDELETDLYSAMTTNQVSLVQEIMQRRIATPSGTTTSAIDTSSSQQSSTSRIDPDVAREVVSRVFWRCCSEPATLDPVIQALVGTGLVNFRFVDDISDRNCLHEAAMTGRLSLLKLGVEHGVSPETFDVYGRSPLHYVSMYGHAECATYLLSMQASMSATDHDGFTPLIYSIMNGHTKCVEIFLENNVAIEASKEGDPIPLSLACHYGHEDIAMMLIGRGANVTDSNADGLEPLHITCREGHIKLTLTLTKRGARLDQADKYMCWTPLFYAASEGHVECVKILLDAGCNVNVVDELGKTPIYYAASEGHSDCVQLLVEAGVKFEGSNLDSCGDSIMDIPAPRSALEVAGLMIGTESALDSVKMESPGLGPLGGSAMEDLDMDFIPSLSLPPPIIPFRVYGHNYLDKKFQINLSLGHPNYATKNAHAAPVHLYGTAQISSLKLIISSRPDNGMIPHNVILPLGDDREVFSFQVDTLDQFSVEFDIYPTFGSKAIGRAVALPSTFSSMESSTGKGVLPLFDAHLKVVGELAFEYSVVRPFEGVRLEVGGRVETYWKSTNSIDSTISAATTPVVGTPSTVMPIGTMGSSTTALGGALTHSTTSQSLLVGNMIPSFITASSLSGEYIQLSIQLTRDLVPVVFAGWHLPVEGFDLALSDVTYKQFKTFGEIYLQHSKNGADGKEEGGINNTRMANSWRSTEWRQKVYERWMSLEQVLKVLPKHIGVNLELKYPTVSEKRFNRLTNVADLNKFVDTILQTVYDSSSATHHRSFMFSSFNPMICSALNWKQPNYAVFFSTYCGYNKSRAIASMAAAAAAEAAALKDKNPNEQSQQQSSGNSSPLKRKEPREFGSSPASPKHGPAITTGLSFSSLPHVSSPVSKPMSAASISSVSSLLLSPHISSLSSAGKAATAAAAAAQAAQAAAAAAASSTNNKAASSAVTLSEIYFVEDDRRCNSIKEAVKFARSNNLLGVICEATPLVQVPSLITHIKESGLILTSFGWGNRDANWIKIQRNYGVDACMVTEEAGEASSSSSDGSGFSAATTATSSSSSSTSRSLNSNPSATIVTDMDMGVLRYQNGVDSGAFSL